MEIEINIMNILQPNVNHRSRYSFPCPVNTPSTHPPSTPTTSTPSHHPSQSHPFFARLKRWKDPDYEDPRQRGAQFWLDPEGHLVRKFHFIHLIEIIRAMPVHPNANHILPCRFFKYTPPPRLEKPQRIWFAMAISTSNSSAHVHTSPGFFWNPRPMSTKSKPLFSSRELAR